MKFATDKQIEAALAEAEKWMQESPSAKNFKDARYTTKMLLTEFLLNKQKVTMYVNSCS